MKKSKQETTPRRDESRPAKPAASPPGKPGRSLGVGAGVPSYDGPKKTDKMPGGKAGPARPAKATLKPGPMRRPSKGTDLPTGDQILRSAHGESNTGAGREQYIRIRMRVHNDRLSVLDSHLVDGPLAQPNVFSGTHVYEVSIGDRILHAEALPDVGVQRSFVKPSGPQEQRGHYITVRPIFEFTARVPANEVSRDTIGRIVLRLHRLKEEARTDRLGSAPLARQFAREIRQVAELVGLPMSVLPSAIEERGGRAPGI